jgi:CheY-like chemotaxis protein
MGAISGNTILHLFKKAAPSKPVYLMTARVDYDTETAIQEGFDGFLQKPFKIKDLETIFGLHASNEESSPKSICTGFSDFPDLCEMLADDEEAIRGVLTVFAQSTADHLYALNDCLEHDDFLRAHDLCHKMLPMFIQLQQGDTVPFLTKMNESKGKDSNVYPEWRDDAVQFMSKADKLLELLSEKYGIC